MLGRLERAAGSRGWVLGLWPRTNVGMGSEPAVAWGGWGGAFLLLVFGASPFPLSSGTDLVCRHSTPGISTLKVLHLIQFWNKSEGTEAEISECSIRQKRQFGSSNPNHEQTVKSTAFANAHRRGVVFCKPMPQGFNPPALHRNNETELLNSDT